MANSECSLRVASYNSRSVKNSIKDVIGLCDEHDIVCLQEHWLLPSELVLLSNIHNDFYSISSSAVDITSDILLGRPYGGTAILYRKSLCNIIDTLQVSNTRITGLKIRTTSGPILFLTVYMPTDYNDDESLEKYVDTCADISALYTDCDTPHICWIYFYPAFSSSRRIHASGYL